MSTSGGARPVVRARDALGCGQPSDVDRRPWARCSVGAGGRSGSNNAPFVAHFLKSGSCARKGCVTTNRRPRITRLSQLQSLKRGDPHAKGVLMRPPAPPRPPRRAPAPPSSLSSFRLANVGPRGFVQRVHNRLRVVARAARMTRFLITHARWTRVCQWPRGLRTRGRRRAED